MTNIKIITDSSADMTDSYYETHQIEMVPFYVTFDKVKYIRERIDINNSEFYHRLRTENVFPSTSQPTIGDYESFFTPILDSGTDIICICISEKFSGSYQSAVNAMRLVKEKFPNRRIAVIDSIQATSGQGLLVEEIVKMRDQGIDFDTIVSTAERIKESARVIFTLDSLEYLVKGGRIGKAASIAGSLLQIKPIIVMQEGELVPLIKVRGRKKATKSIIDLASAQIGDKLDKYYCIIVHSDCLDEANALQNELSSLGYKFEFSAHELGITIGSHTGPTLIGIAFLKKYQECL